MDKQILDYFDHKVNVCQGQFSIGREQIGKMEYIVITIDGKEVYSFWRNPNKRVSKEPPKHTGGKPSYVKLMLQEMQKYNLSLEAAGFVNKMTKHIRWGDNLLIDRRTKKPLVVEDFCTIIGKSKPVTLKIIGELKGFGLLTKDKEGYRISPNLVQKGGGYK